MDLLPRMVEKGNILVFILGTTGADRECARLVVNG